MRRNHNFYFFLVIVGVGLIFGALYVSAANASPASQVLGTTSFPQQINQEQIPTNPDISWHYPEKCIECHDFGGECGICHQIQRPYTHFEAECSYCHSLEAWDATEIDHTRPEYASCDMCHLDVQPDDHYSNQCSACHTYGDWSEVNFAHVSITDFDCASCHADLRPDGHFSG